MKKKKVQSILKAIFGVGTLGMLGHAGAKIVEHHVESNPTKDEENTVGYEGINLYYNTQVHTNNFVVLHVKNTSGYDLTDLRAKLEKCNELGVEVSLVLDTNAEDLATIYTDVDFLQAIVKEYKIDLPIYLNIDNVMQCSSTNNAQKKEIINAFLDKTSRSDMYIGVYGSDSNLADCKEYVLDLSRVTTFSTASSMTAIASPFSRISNSIEDEENMANRFLPKLMTSRRVSLFSPPKCVTVNPSIFSLYRGRVV